MTNLNKVAADHIEMIGVIQRLMRTESDALGFLTTTAIQFHAATGGVYVIWDRGGDVVAYIIFARGKASAPQTAHVYQVWVKRACRKKHIGSKIVEAACDIAKKAGATSIECYVAQELEANHFWEAVGFQLVGAREGGKRRKRHHNHYRKDLL